MRRSRLCVSAMRSTWVNPASRKPSSRIAARIGLSSTIAILRPESRCSPEDNAPWPDESDPLPAAAEFLVPVDIPLPELRPYRPSVSFKQDPFQPDSLEKPRLRGKVNERLLP